jgi:hypothetical protein
VLAATIPFSAVPGSDFDHFDVDRGHKRLFVLLEVNSSIEIFRLSAGAHLSSLRDIARSPHK